MKRVIKIGKKNVTVHNGDKLRVGADGKPLPAGEVYAGMSKGEARRLRKQLRANGECIAAAQPRATK
jgi:hypothetical protein